jgi:hypothetical protein
MNCVRVPLHPREKQKAQRQANNNPGRHKWPSFPRQRFDELRASRDVSANLDGLSISEPAFGHFEPYMFFPGKVRFLHE